MQIILLTALGVGGATVLGGGIGFAFRGLSRKFGNLFLSFAAGVMLAAAILELILPALEYPAGLACAVAGVLLGAVCMRAINRFVPQLHRLVGAQAQGDAAALDRVLLFVCAIAIHNLPEGIAAGVGFGTGRSSEALLIAGGIALQNIPEGMVIIAPMLGAGISPRRTFLCALVTGLIEVVGTFLGYWAVHVAAALLPAMLGFAGGTMLYVICEEMIPRTHAHGRDGGATYALLGGFCLMVVFDAVLNG